MSFIDLECIGCVAVYGEPESSRLSSHNILICVSKMNKGFVGLERHEGE